MRIFLIVDLLSLDQLDMQFRAFLESVIIQRPSRNNPEIILPSFELDNEIIFALLHPLLQILDQLCRIIAEIDINSLRFRLKNAVFVP